MRTAPAPRLRTVLLGAALSLALSPAAHRAALASDAGLVDLLRLPGVTIEETTAPEADKAGLRALLDGDPATGASAAASETAPLDVVFSFGGATVSPERLVVRLPEKPPPGASAARVEVLVSTASAQAGFRSLRGDPLQASAKPQSFAFPAAGAQWVLVRLTPAAGSDRVAVADLSLLGREGPPVTVYEFAESPARAFDVLASLKSLTSLAVTVSPDESAMFEDVKDGRFHRFSFAEAALVSCGVLDAEKRKAYGKTLDALEAQARAAVEAGKTPAEKGDALLKWLHAGPMSKGYVAGQTDLSAVLDTGKFNCVSSATLYDVIGRRLGLDVRAIEVPTHAFAVLYDGTEHADVETTTPGGFNPSRDKKGLARFEALTGFSYIPDLARDKRREVGEAGLVAITYYNHGVLLYQQKRYHEALLAYFRAMSLDSECASAVKNALATLANWSLELAKAKKFEDALTVLKAGLDLAPKDALLRNNRTAVWGDWARAAMDAGKPDEAVAILKRAAGAVPDGGFEGMQAWLFLKGAEEQVRAGQYEKALALLEPGFRALNEGPRAELSKWKANLYLRWSSAEQRKGNFEEAVLVLDKARAAVPEDKRYANNIGYLAQEWSKSVHAKSGAEAAEAVLGRLLARFPDVPEVKNAARGHVQRTVNELVKQGKREEALALVTRQSGRFVDAADAKGLAAYVYDAWASALSKSKEWQAAVDVYAKALAAYPGDDHLTKNSVATFDLWGHALMKDKDWPHAVEVYKKALERHPGNRPLEKNLKYCEQQAGK